MRDPSIAVLCLLAACAGEKQADSGIPADTASTTVVTAGAPPVTMLCGADTISVQGASTDSILQLHVLGETFLVGRVPSGSGAKYQAGSDTSTFYWNHGGQSLVQVRGEAFPQCEMIP